MIIRIDVGLLPALPEVVDILHHGSVLIVLGEHQDGNVAQQALARFGEHLERLLESCIDIVGLVLAVHVARLLCLMPFEPLLGQNTRLQLKAGCVGVVLEHFWLPVLSGDWNSQIIRLIESQAPRIVETALQIHLSLFPGLFNGFL